MKDLLKRPLHRRLERNFNLKNGSLKKAVSDLKEKYKFTDQEILVRAKECADYCLENKNRFDVAFNLYVSCLNNRKVGG
jgi:uridine kinase